jgi:hypothetical protein
LQITRTMLGQVKLKRFFTASEWIYSRLMHPYACFCPFASERSIGSSSTSASLWIDCQLPFTTASAHSFIVLHRRWCHVTRIW